MASRLVKYETDSGQIVRIRLSTEKIALAGTEPAGTITDNRIRVAAAGSTRQFNTIVSRARLYTFSETTAGGLVATQSLRLPVLSIAAFSSTPPATVTYKGKTYAFSNLNAED